MLLPPRIRRTEHHYEIVAAFLAGTLSGAFMSALTLWLLAGFFAPLPQGVRLSALLAGGLLVLLSKEGPLEGKLWLPEAKRQIPVEVFGRGFIPGAYRFGLELGTGVRTYIPSAAPYLVLLLILLGRPSLGDTLFIALGYGFGRAIPLMVQLSAAGRKGTTAGFMVGKVQCGQMIGSVLVLGGMLSLAA